MEQQTRYFGLWGIVPIDGDVRPFSVVNPIRDDRYRDNRKHHFVSRTYMDGFTGDRSRVHVYLTEAPEDPHPMAPSAIGFENYYYSQKLPDGGQENHKWEGLWNSIESVWPETVKALETRRLSPAISFNTLGMLGIMRARVPAARDRVALLLEAKMRCECQALDDVGKLPPELERYAGKFDTTPIGVNPQQTLSTMMDDLKDIGDLCFKLSFEVLHNRTGVPFLTSDNPVCSYDPKQALVRRIPYDHSGEIELLFPVTAEMMVRGTNKRGPVNVISRHRDLSDAQTVRRFNRTIAQFAYRMTIAKDRSCDEIIRSHAALVPTISTEVHRHDKKIEIRWRHVFGPRPTLSQFIDTPEKAARLEALMTAHGET